MIHLLIILLGLYVLANVFTYPLQDLFIFRPRKLKRDFKFEFHYPFEEHFLETPNHGWINLIWFRKAEASTKLILYCHGNAGNLHRWGKITEQFCQYGYDVIVFDYRGFGKSRGLRNERNMMLDAQAVYNYVLQTYEAKNIVIFGRSMGSGVACELAKKNEHQTLILETPFSSIRDLFTSYYPFLPGRMFIFKYRFRNDLCLKEMNSEIYIFQGTKDTVVPYRCAVKLRPLLRNPDNFIIIPQGKHHNLGDFKIYQEHIRQILNG